MARRSHDAYLTPHWLVDALIAHLDADKLREMVVCEPAAGDMRIFDKLEAKKKVWFEIQKERDYLKYDIGRGRIDAHITNPPFSLAQEFITKALGEASVVIMLQRVNFLGAEKRMQWWQDKLPTHLLVSSKRPSFTDDGKTDGQEYAWYVWDYEKTGLCALPPGIHVI